MSTLRILTMCQGGMWGIRAGHQGTVNERPHREALWSLFPGLPTLANVGTHPLAVVPPATSPPPALPLPVLACCPET